MLKVGLRHLRLREEYISVVQICNITMVPECGSLSGGTLP